MSKRKYEGKKRGPKPRHGNKVMVQYPARVTRDQLKLVRSWAHRDKTTVSQITREMICRELNIREGITRVITVKQEA